MEKSTEPLDVLTQMDAKDQSLLHQLEKALIQTELGDKIDAGARASNVFTQFQPGTRSYWENVKWWEAVKPNGKLPEGWAKQPVPKFGRVVVIGRDLPFSQMVRQWGQLLIEAQQFKDQSGDQKAKSANHREQFIADQRMNGVRSEIFSNVLSQQLRQAGVDNYYAAGEHEFWRQVSSDVPAVYSDDESADVLADYELNAGAVKYLLPFYEAEGSRSYAAYYGRLWDLHHPGGS